MANVKLNNAKLQMKVDMEATLSIISEEDIQSGLIVLKLQFHCGNHWSITCTVGCNYNIITAIPLNASINFVNWKRLHE